MRQRSFGHSAYLLAYACAVSALFLFLKGYTFNTNDQGEHLPQVYQMLDIDLYSNDYFVNASNAIFTVRYYYEHLVLFVGKTIGFEWGLFILTFGCIALMAYSFVRMAEVIFINNRWAVLLAPILTMFVFYNYTVGGNHIMYGSFISSTLAKSLAAFGLLQFVNRKHLISGLILGISTLIQPLVGLQLFTLLFIYQAMVVRNWGRTFAFGFSYTILASLIVAPVLQRQFAAGDVFDEQLYYEILYRFRNHHHYIPSLFPLNHYIKFGLILVVGLVSYVFLRPKDRYLFPILSTTAILGMMVYWIGLEYLEIHSFGKLQWFKTTVWIEALSAIMVAGFIGNFLPGLLSHAKWRKLVLASSLVVAVVLLMAITNSEYLPSSFQNKYMIGNRVYSDLEDMHSWIEKNTDKQAVFLVSPDNNGFSCQAKRSMPIHYQAIIHEPFFMLAWYEDYKEIYGVSIENLEGIDARKHAASLFQTRNYRGGGKRINYRLDNLETCTFTEELGPIVHQNGKWMLTEYLVTTDS